MSAVLNTRTVDGVRILEIANPPVNALAQAVRAELLSAAQAADQDPTVRALLITGSGAHFVAGADIREFDAGPKPPLNNDVLLRVEACSKPVIAAIRGSALGGGLELALACHYRCATTNAQFGLPEVKLGVLPGAGATVRLPRLIGIEAALSMMISGEPIDCLRARELGLIDRVLPDGDLRAEALVYVTELLMQRARPRPLRERSINVSALPPDFFAQQEQAATKLARGYGSQPAIVRCVEAAATQTFDEALTLTRKLFEERRVSMPARALRHMFFAERGSKVAATPRPVHSIGVIGSGTMGSGIAVSLALANYAVILLDTKIEALQAGMTRLRETIDASARKGRLSAEQASGAIARVSTASDYSALGNVDLVIEAVFESMAVKQEVFGQLDRLCKPGAVLATNTSTLDIDAIANATQRPADVLGMHFFSPANLMRLVEMVRGGATTPEALATALAVTRRMGKLGIVVGNCFGFVGNRMLYAYGRENQSMLLEGAAAMQIDAALKKFGMAMGPNAVGDLAGLDVGYRVRREREDLPADARYYRVADLLVEAGRLGQKTARGMFRYETGSREPIADPKVEALIAAESARLGIVRRPISDEEIVDRCTLALASEGARILDRGIAESSADIDAIWCNGYGFPRWRGGPMFYTDSLDSEYIQARAAEFAARPGLGYWTALAATLLTRHKRPRS